MYICVECRAPIDSLVRRENSIPLVQICPHCEASVDKYIEHDHVYLALALFLLRPSAWNHLLHNSSLASVPSLFLSHRPVQFERDQELKGGRKSLLGLYCLVLITCVLDAVMVQMSSPAVLSEFLSTSSGNCTAGEGSHSWQRNASQTNPAASSLVLSGSTGNDEEETDELTRVLPSSLGPAFTSATALSIRQLVMSCRHSSLHDRGEDLTEVLTLSLHALVEFIFFALCLMWGMSLVGQQVHPSLATSTTSTTTTDSSSLASLRAVPTGDHNMSTATSPSPSRSNRNTAVPPGTPSSSSSSSLRSTRSYYLTTGWRAACLSVGIKLIYILFLIWDIPIFFLIVVEGASIIWVYASVQSAIGQSVPKVVFVTALGLLAKMVLRIWTHWAPIFLVWNVIDYFPLFFHLQT